MIIPVYKFLLIIVTLNPFFPTGKIFTSLVERTFLSSKITGVDQYNKKPSLLVSRQVFFLSCEIGVRMGALYLKETSH